MTQQMHLLIVEPDPSGHRMVLHVRLIVQEAVARGWRVDVLTSRAAAEHSALHAVRAVLPANSVVHFLADYSKGTGSGRIALLRQQWDAYRSLAHSITHLAQQIKPTVTYLINLDNVYQVLAITRKPFGGTPFAGMMMGLGYHRRATGLGKGRWHDRIAEGLFRRVLRLPSLRAVTVIDSAFHAHASRAGVPEYSKLSYVPDVGSLECIGSRSEVRSAMNIPDDRFVILVYGSLSRRKGLAELMEAVASSPDLRVVLLLAGQADAGATTFLQGNVARLLTERGQIIRSEGFHDAEREGRVFAAADAVWIGYVGFYGSSGVLYQAGAASLPVIAAQEGLIGWLTARHGLGACCVPAERDTVIAAISSIANDPELARESGRRGRKLADSHTPEQFAAAICDAIERSRP
jgi:glycosyltransferase involved in cell wall biosynthesis